MRIAVVGGTGRAGRHTIEALRRTGHDAIALARASGVDVVSGTGLDLAQRAPGDGGGHQVTAPVGDAAARHGRRVGR